MTWIRVMHVPGDGWLASASLPGELLRLFVKASSCVVFNVYLCRWEGTRTHTHNGSLISNSVSALFITRPLLLHYVVSRTSFGCLATS